MFLQVRRGFLPGSPVTVRRATSGGQFRTWETGCCCQLSCVKIIGVCLFLLRLVPLLGLISREAIRTPDLFRVVCLF